MTKLITVFGSTGNQGGSVVRCILNHPELSKQWKIRGVTRDPSKPNAQALVAKGVEMVAADLGSKDSILSAIKDSSVVFGVTNYWEKGTLENEVLQGKNLANAAKEAGVEHLIWSSLPYVSKITNGELSNLHHFDSKAMIEEYITELGIPASFVLAGFFMSNLPNWTTLNDSGTGYTMSIMAKSDTNFPLLDVPRDFGKFVAACLANPSATLGKHILAASEWSTPNDMARAFSNATGKKTEFYAIPPEEYTGGQEMSENFFMIIDHAYYGPEAKEGVKSSQEAVEKVGGFEGLGTFEGFLKGVGFK